MSASPPPSAWQTAFQTFKKQLFIILALTLVVLVLFGLLRFGEWYYYLGLAGSFKQGLLQRTALSPDLAEALAWLYAAAFAYFVIGIAVSTRDLRRGIALWLASYAVLPLMAAVFPKPTPPCLALNPKTGKTETSPCYETGTHPDWHTPVFRYDKILHQVSVTPSTPFFTIDQTPMLAYVEENGAFTFYDKPGFTPDGKMAVWVTKESVDRWKASLQNDSPRRKRRL